MYLWTIDYNNIKSYLIPSYHFNINLLFTKDELQKLETIIGNSDVVCFESLIKKSVLSEEEKKLKLKTQIKKSYTSDDMLNIVNELNRVLKTNLETKDIEKKDIMTLLPGTGIGLLTSDLKNIMDHKLQDIAKNKKKEIVYLDSGKAYKKSMDKMGDQVKNMRKYTLEHPFTLDDIFKYISLTKQTIHDYRKLYDKKNFTKIYNNRDKELTDDRNLNWLPKIVDLLEQNKAIVIIVGANHLNLSFENNLISLLEKKYNIDIKHKKI